MDDDSIHLDPLFVGLTRPASIAGIPYGACIFEIMAIAMIFLASGNPLYLLTALPLHGVLYLISAKDPGVFANIGLWLKTNSLCRNSRFWQAASFSPSRFKQQKK